MYTALVICVTVCVSQLVTGKVIGGIDFEELRTYLRTNNDVYHMEPDRNQPGNILYSDGPSIWTTDGQNKSLVVGSPTQKGYTEGTGNLARFESITSFYQLDKDNVVVVDSGNNCLRRVSRSGGVTAVTVPYAGACGKTSFGYQDGSPSTARFYYPWSMIKDDKNNRLLLTELGNPTVRSVDLGNLKVSTLFKADHNYPRSLAFDVKKENLYLTNSNYISKLKLGEDKAVKITGSQSIGHVDGKLDSAQFHFPQGILVLSESTALVADYGSKYLRVIDLVRKSVSSICDGTTGAADGTVDRCQLNDPHSLMKIGDYVYVGQAKAIRRIRIRDKVACNQSDITVKLKQGESLAVVEVTDGVRNFYGAGTHLVTDLQTNCTIKIIILEADQNFCPGDVSAVADKTTGIARVNLRIGKNDLSINLPVGLYPYSIFNCTLSIRVFDGSFKRRLYFKSQYDVKCYLVNENANRNFLQVVARQKFEEIEKICQGSCQRAASLVPSINCKNDKLEVSWPTSVEFEANIQSLPSSLLAQLLNKAKDQLSLLDMVIYTRKPPVVYPILNAQGSPFEPELVSICNNGLTLNPKTLACG